MQMVLVSHSDKEFNTFGQSWTDSSHFISLFCFAFILLFLVWELHREFDRPLAIMKMSSRGGRSASGYIFWHNMMTSSNGNFFCVTGPLCGEFTGHWWIPLTKASVAELCCFFICAWINGWVNNRKHSDFRRHRAHYDVTMMWRTVV